MKHKAIHNLIIVRSGGDIATGIIWTLRNAGFAVLILECARPSAIRTTVSFSEAVYAGESTVEGMRCQRAENEQEAWNLLRKEGLALLVDPKAEAVENFSPADNWTSHGFRLIALIDAVIAKKNLGTSREMAPFVAALGPGFTAGLDCDAVIETMRGHNLGRIITEGSAMPNTGVPGTIAGHNADRVIHAPADGLLHQVRHIGEVVEKDGVIAEIVPEEYAGAEQEDRAEFCSGAYTGTGVLIRAPFTGLLRGLIHEGYRVTEGLKIADIDPRVEERENSFRISDKSRSLGGAVLLAVMMHQAGRIQRRQATITRLEDRALGKNGVNNTEEKDTGRFLCQKTM